MGTNFYYIDVPPGMSEDSIHVHIGKRSAAGKYCHPCGTTFNTGGTREVHYSDTDYEWSDRCPACGMSIEEDYKKSAAGAELGLNMSPPVGSTCSFTWTLMKHKVYIFNTAHNRKIIRDEYGETYTASEFKNMINNFCAIEFQLPREFS